MNRLFILRHGKRDILESDHTTDNGINADGKKQAVKIAEAIPRALGQKKLTRMLSSQRLRCQETLAPLAEKLNLKVEIEPKLLERKSDEDARQFARRIKEFFSAWKAAPEDVWVVCTHGDWIPWFFELATGTSVEFSKGSWAELKLNSDGTVEIVQVKQAS